MALESPLAEGTAELFAKGVQLHNEKDLTKPALLEVITPTEVRLTISEGRYHQVKRMFAAVGNHVVGLHRERIGDILLDESLAPGEYRPLTEAEIASVGARSHGVKRDAEAEFFTGDCVYPWPAGHADAAVY